METYPSGAIVSSSNSSSLSATLTQIWLVYCILSSKVHTFFIENYAEIVPARFTNLIHKQSIHEKLWNERAHYTQ